MDSDGDELVISLRDDDEEDYIYFDGRRLVAAIDYHLRQPTQPHWTRCTRITPTSIRRVKRYLSRCAVKISRKDWRDATDVERLDSLLTEFGITGTMLDDETLELVIGPPNEKDSVPRRTNRM